MATSVSITSTYAGQFSGKYIAAALLSAPTLDKEFITIKPNIKYKEVVKVLSQQNIIFDASCDFQATGSVALTERILQPDEFQVNTQLCKEDFRSDWEAIEMGVSVYDNLPASFTDFLIANTAGQVAQNIEEAIWQGNASLQGEFAGFQSLVSGSATGTVQVLGATQVTSSNVIAELTRVVNSIPNTVYGKEDLMIYAPTNVVKAYTQALAGGAQGANGWNNQLNVGEKPLNFNGIEMAFCPGMSASSVAVAQKSNLFFGTGLLSDYNEVKVIDMANIDGSQNFRVIMRYTAGTQIGIASDIVYYGAY
jgi:hypothetical protein